MVIFTIACTNVLQVWLRYRDLFAVSHVVNSAFGLHACTFNLWQMSLLKNISTHPYFDDDDVGLYSASKIHAEV